MRLSTLVVVAAAIAALPQIKAQSTPGGATYKVEFTIRDASDAAKGARHYTMLIDPDGRGIFKVGDRVPVMTGNQTTYIDVGVNIETHLRESNGKVILSSNIDLSTARPGNPSPTITQTRVDVNATVMPGKPTQVASIDDPANQHKLDVEATVTRLN